MALQITYPLTGQLVVEFSDLGNDTVNPMRTPEGLMRITLWRALEATDAALFGLKNFQVAKGNGDVITSQIYIKAHPRIIMRRPKEGKKKERYFGQPLFDGFDMEMYNTPYQEDILECWTQTPDVTGKRFAEATVKPIEGSGFLDRYLRTQRKQDVYCMMEFMQWDEDDYKVVQVGLMQESYQGTEKRWDHPLTKNPYLDRGTNKEFYAERIYTYRFGSVPLLALGNCPARPTTDPTNTTSWYMPFYNPTGQNSALPYDYIGAYPMTVATPPTPAVRQGVSNYNYTNNAAVVRKALWRRHINVRKALKAVFDFSFGENTPTELKYIFECDDGLMLLHGGKLSSCEPVGVGVTGVPSCIPEYELKTVNFGFDANVEKWLLLPQCLWGLYDEIPAAVGDDIVPVPPKHWGNAYESAWEWIVELCYMVGLVPKSRVGGTREAPVQRIRFIQKDKHELEKFTTIVPNKEPKKEIFPESEEGISVERRQSFKNPATDDGDFQDIGAYKVRSAGGIGVSGWTFPGGYYKSPQLNPFVVPATSQNPAGPLTLSLVMGGDSCYVFSLGKESILWCSTGRDESPATTTWDGTTLDSICKRTENYPMFSPLVFNNYGWTDALLDTVLADSKISVEFRPVVGGTWIVPSTGQYDPYSRSMRELSARFYAARYVRPDFKRTEEYGTCTQFRNITTGKNHWSNLEIDYLHDIFTDEYYVHAFTRDWDRFVTSVEYLSDGIQTGHRSIDEKDEQPMYTPSVPNPPNPIGLSNNVTLTGAEAFAVIVQGDGIPVTRVTYKVTPPSMDEVDVDFQKGDVWSVEIDTSLYTNGTKTLTLKAYDINGQASSASTYTINILN